MLPRTDFFPWWQMFSSNCLIVCSLVCSWLALPLDVAAQFRFRSIDAQESGVDFRHSDGGSGQRYIVEYVGAGLVTFDYDDDGLLDLYFLNGGTLQGTHYEQEPTNKLYRNLGGMRFEDVTDESGVGNTGHSLGATAGDLDNDGDQDLFVNNFGANVLYINQGDGTFVAEQSLGMTQPSVGAGVCMLDANNDGVLDLFVANYVDFRYENHVQRKHRGHSVYPSPKDFAPRADQLLISDATGGFTDQSLPSGIAESAGTGMGAVSFDFEQDGDADIFVCNDVMGNFLYQNEGDGVFVENGLLSGVAVDFEGVMQGSMGVDCGDYDLDGYLDLIVTSYQNELPTLYRNSGLGFFEDVSAQSGDFSRAAPDVTWGVSFSDFDNDQDPDLFMASGHLMDNITDTDDTQSYSATNLWFVNQAGKFRLLESVVSNAQARVSRGSAAADLDGDGDTDVVLLNSNALPTLLENQSQTEANWIQVELVGTEENRDAVGSEVILETAQRKLVQQVHSGRGYQGHQGMRLHFGLGAETVDSIKVRWMSSQQEESFSVKSNQVQVLVQGAGAGL